jgi:hypothetical protein
MDEKNPYNIYYMSNIQVNNFIGVRPDNPAGFVQISGKSSIRPDSKNHYPVHPYRKHYKMAKSNIETFGNC